MINGKIIKGIGGFYYVETEEGLIECRAKGKFRKDKIKPLIGDNVEIRLTKEDTKKGYIENIIERKNSIIRPSVANVEQIIIVFSVTNPKPDFLLLDKLLIASEINNINPIICFNKIDLITSREYYKYINIYKNTDYPIICTSKYNKDSIEELKESLKNKTSVFSGPSGVGKSSLMNEIQPNLKLKTGEISDKLKRGKHTTRHAEILKLDFGGWVVDTPGFSSFNLKNIKYDKLYLYFKEIKEHSFNCMYRGCMHYKEPNCSVKKALEEQYISNERYSNYLKLYQQLKEGVKR